MPRTPDPFTEELEQAAGMAAAPLLDTELEAVVPPPPWPPGQAGVLAAVGLVGPWRGDLYLHADHESARQIALAMLGAAEEGDRSLVQDAVGELTNVLAGACKHALDPQGTSFELTVPRFLAPTDEIVAEPGSEISGLGFEGPGVTFAIYLVREPEGPAQGPMISSWG